MEAPSLLQELDDAVSRGSAESRLRALWHTTDLLIAGTYTEDQIWTFGEVIGRLASEIEVAARTQLAKRLARIDNAPIKIINKLAFDDSIDVAGPILRYSERLDVRTLVDNVRTKSQSHLLAISKRNSIAIPVTDELVARGNQKVVSSVAANNGARFSDFGFLHMIKRSESDSILAEQLGLRKDIPRHLFQQLIAKASDDVKKKLARERPDIASQILSSVTDVTGALHSKFGPASKNYFTAKRVVASKHQYGNLTENSILEYARSRKVEETTVVAVAFVLIACRRGRACADRKQQGNDIDLGESPRLLVGDRDVVAFPSRERSSNRCTRPGWHARRVYSSQHPNMPECSRVLSFT